MTTAPETRYPAKRLEQPMTVLEEALECSDLTTKQCKDFRQRMGEALLWEAIKTVHILEGALAEVAPSAGISKAKREAALHRQKVLVHALLSVAVATLLVSMYVMGLGHDAVGWFGFAGALGLAYMAHRAEQGR